MLCHITVDTFRIYEYAIATTKTAFCLYTHFNIMKIKHANLKITFLEFSQLLIWRKYFQFSHSSCKSLYIYFREIMSVKLHLFYYFHFTLVRHANFHAFSFLIESCSIRNCLFSFYFVFFALFVLLLNFCNFFRRDFKVLDWKRKFLYLIIMINKNIKTLYCVLNEEG